MKAGRDQLVFFAFDLLFLNGHSTAHLPLIERKERLKRLFKQEIQGLRYNHTHRAIAGSGSSRSASIARSSWSLDGPTRREPGSTSAPCCWVTTPKMDARRPTPAR
jgi:hypothetical protein